MGSLRVNWSAAATYPDGTPFPATAGFEVSSGLVPGTYTQTVDAGNVTSLVLTGLTAGRTYHVAVRAYDGIGNVSAYSTEVSAVATPDHAVHFAVG